MHQIAHAAFKIIQRLVGANACDHDAIDRVPDAGGVLLERERASNAVVLGARALQQRLSSRCFKIGVPDAWKSLSACGP